MRKRDGSSWSLALRLASYTLKAGLSTLSMIHLDNTYGYKCTTLPNDRLLMKSNSQIHRSGRRLPGPERS